MAPRLTESGACASCGAYGNSSHQSTCKPDRKLTYRLVSLWRVRRDSRNSAAARALARLDRGLVRVV